jgi:hypothetical protein
MKKCIYLSICFLVLLAGESAYALTGAWERHCEACHDGQTILNGRVVIDKEQMKAKYSTLQEFVNACGASPSCMNIVKHGKKLLMEAGKDIGLKDTLGK